MAIAFFDFDKTLIRKNSGSLWLRHEIRGGRIRTTHALRAALMLGTYKLGYVRLDAGIRFAIQTLEGTKESELRDRVAEFYQKEVRRHYRDRALREVERHREQGDHLVLLTSASLYLSEVVRDDLGLHDVLCNRFEVDADGRFTGEPEGTLCYGPGKRVHAEAFAADRAESLDEATFYTDSMADLPALEAVGHPRVVNPDPRLARQARRRNWPILDWD